MNILVGSIVPLSLQLFNGREDLRVVVKAIDDLKRVVFEDELMAVEGGLYVSRMLKMPDCEWLLATYVVFDGTIESKDYERASDLFVRDRSADVVAVVETRSQALEDRIAPNRDGYLTGTMGDLEECHAGVMTGRLLEDGTATPEAAE